jgi:hypothetical protein
MSRPPENPQALIEDIEFMTRHGESLNGAATRLDRTPAALERALQRLGRHDLVSALRARNPINPARSDQQREARLRYVKDHAA